VAAHPDVPPVAVGGREPAPPNPAVVGLAHATSGLANETVLLELGDGHPGLAVRLPPLEPTFPHYDLRTQATVQNAVASAGVPAPAPALAVDDPQWIGTPFLVMPRVVGHIPGPAPLFDPWIADAGVARQRAVHTALVDTLVAVHAVDWAGLGLGGVLPGPSCRDALEYWSEYVQWATEGSPTPALADALAWCAGTVPDPVPDPDHDGGGGAPVLVWGDPRLGNLVFADDLSVRAVLDWELAAIGPAGMDLGWFLGLESMMDELFGRAVPGFAPREDTMSRYTRATGRALDEDTMAWHEIFALVRALSVNERQQRVAAASGRRYVGGTPARDPEADPLARVLRAKVQARSSRERPSP